MRPEVTSRQHGPAPRLTRRRAITLGAGAAIGLAFAGPAMAQQASTPQTAPFSLMTTQEAYDAAKAGDIILVDIRTPEEWRETGIGEGAIALDMRSDDFVKKLVALRVANPDTPIALMCRTGNRSQFATSALAGQGFPGLVDVQGGMVGSPKGKGWLENGLPVYAGTPENVAARLAEVLPAQ